MKNKEMSPAEVEYKSSKKTKKKKEGYYFDRLKEFLGKDYAKKALSKSGY